MRTVLEDCTLQDPRIKSGLKLAMVDLVPADNFVITADMPTVLRCTPAGAIDMLLPASNEKNRGLVFIVVNIGAGGIITLKASDDTAFSPTITTAVSGGWSAVICTGSSTVNTGWREIMSEIAVGT